MSQGRGKFAFERFLIENRDFAAVHLDETLRLQPGQVARDELPDGTDLGGEILVTRAQRERDAPAALPALGARRAQQPRDKAMANGREGKFFDDADQPPQT